LGYVQSKSILTIMKPLFVILIALFIVGCYADKQLSNQEKFDLIQVGMPMKKALSTFGFEDSVGKSFSYTMEMVEIVDTAAENVETIPTGKFLTVYYINLDSIYQIQIHAVTVFEKNNLTEFNSILRTYGMDSLISPK
jgi:hypothetical protein